MNMGKQTTGAKPGFRVLQGIDYGKDKRAEAGKVVFDLPESSVPWLLEGGYIEPADGADVEEDSTDA
jgi:hypothetical protein